MDDKENPSLILLGALLALAFGVCIGWAAVVTPENRQMWFVDWGAGIGAVAAIILQAARTQSLLVSLLAVSFVFSGLREDIGFFYFEPWMVVVVVCFVGWAFEIAKHRRFSIKLDGVGLCALFVVVSATVFGV